MTRPGMPLRVARFFDDEAEQPPTFEEWVARNRRELAAERAAYHAEVDRVYDLALARLDGELEMIGRAMREQPQH